MSAKMIVSLCAMAIVAVSFYGVANAIDCFSCMGQSGDCESGLSTNCPSSAEYCKLEWTASTGYTSQSCATQSDCPVSGTNSGSDSTSETGGDINNCCNYDKCNCIGSQCNTASIAIKISLLSMVASLVMGYFTRF